MKNPCLLVIPLLAAALFASAATALAGETATAAQDLKTELRDRTDKAVNYLRSQQKDGKWMEHPGVTALCLQAILGSPRKYTAKDGPFIRLPLEYLQAMQQPDGSICDPKMMKPNENYCTSLAMLAFMAAKDPALDANIKKAQEFLRKIQADEGENYDPKKDYHYGGIGYGGDERPDLCNLQWALEALKASGLDAKDPAFQKAVTFINRCQDGEANDQPWAKGGGGFKYAPECKDDPVYGSMTFAGIRSLVFCSVAKDDPRIAEALGWVSKNFALAEHPGMGQVSLYFYYFSMAKTLSLLDLTELKLENGRSVDWRKELAVELSKRQAADGSWVNPEKKYMEGVPVLATAYGLSAMNMIYSSMK